MRRILDRALGGRASLFRSDGRCSPWIPLSRFNSTPCHAQRRGLKTKTTVKIKQIHQGSLGTVTKVQTTEEDEPAYPRTVQQHLNNVKKFTGCVVLTRVGNFYEMYGEQAEKYGPLLNLKVASRKTSHSPVAMSGFQIFQLDRHLKTLVQELNMPVAISEEIRNSAADQVKHGGLLYDRKVSRVITAGTLIDEAFMDPLENNFLLSVYSDHQLATHGENDDGPVPTGNGLSVGLCWVDLSSGDFFLQQTSAKALSSMVARIAPKEILVDSFLEDVDRNELKDIFGEGSFALTHHDDSGSFDTVEKWSVALDEPLQSQEVDFADNEIAAASLLLDYVRTKLHDIKVTLRKPTRWTDKDAMLIDKHSLRGLEIRSTIREDGFSGSLLHAIRRTVTTSGARALSRRLGSPSMDLRTINERLDLVQTMVEEEELREATINMLGRTFDMPRLIQKFSSGRGDADDLLSIQKTIIIMDTLFNLVMNYMDKTCGEQLTLVSRDLEAIDFKRLLKLAKLISDSIDEDGLSRQRTIERDEKEAITEFVEEAIENEAAGKKTRKPPKRDTRDADLDEGDIWIMRKGASRLLLETHTELEERFAEKADLCSDLRAKFANNTLSLKWTPQLGHYCHVRAKALKIDHPGLREIGSSKTTRTFLLQEWTELGRRMDNIKLRIRAEEQRVFIALRHEIITNLVKLRRCASILDELDISCSSAILAKERRLVRPILHNGTTQTIIGGRHATVDVGLEESGRSFVANDCLMPDTERVLLITGPNMAGKSTYLRQNALIAILAQTGCFVPAEYAELGLVDKIFTRVGSADNVSRHQSTFMVEMIEVAAILNEATRRSFVVMDEVGRGTTPEDGVAVGFACLQHLHDKVGCRTLFATHFHALADMTAGMERVGRWCTDVEEEEGGSWVYVHRLRRGVNRESHALKVARLAGMPEEAVETARRVLAGMKGRAGQRSDEDDEVTRAASG